RGLGLGDPAHAADPRRPTVTRQELDLGLGLLDHQLVDSEGRNCGNVDDLELVLADNGAEVTEILVGGNAWRSRGLLGRLAARLPAEAVHVPRSEVESVSSVVKLTRPAAEARLNRGDDTASWPIAKLPGDA